jgi:hypothetical protein
MKKPLKATKCKYCHRLEPEIKLVRPNCIKIQCCEECYNSPDACEKLKRMKIGHKKTAAKRYIYSIKYKREYRKKHWDHALYRSAFSRAKKLNVPFEISRKDIIVPKYCPVLGIELKQAEGRMNDASPTLDRLNPVLGYVKGNICVMSNRANRLKSNGTLEDHEKIVAFMKTLVDKK